MIFFVLSHLPNVYPSKTAPWPNPSTTRLTSPSKDSLDLRAPAVDRGRILDRKLKFAI